MLDLGCELDCCSMAAVRKATKTEKALRAEIGFVQIRVNTGWAHGNLSGPWRGNDFPTTTGATLDKALLVKPCTDGADDGGALRFGETILREFV